MRANLRVFSVSSLLKYPKLRGCEEFWPLVAFDGQEHPLGGL